MQISSETNRCGFQFLQVAMSNWNSETHKQTHFWIVFDEGNKVNKKLEHKDENFLEFQLYFHATIIREIPPIQLEIMKSITINRREMTQRKKK
jgi:hypothetical protein